MKPYFSHCRSAVTATSSKVEGLYQKMVSVDPTSECVLASMYKWACARGCVGV